MAPSTEQARAREILSDLRRGILPDGTTEDTAWFNKDLQFGVTQNDKMFNKIAAQKLYDALNFEDVRTLFPMACETDSTLTMKKYEKYLNKDGTAWKIPSGLTKGEMEEFEEIYIDAYHHKDDRLLPYQIFVSYLLNPCLSLIHI